MVISASSITVHVDDAKSMDAQLERAETMLRNERTMSEGRGILIIRKDFTTFVITASKEVPYGETHARWQDAIQPRT